MLDNRKADWGQFEPSTYWPNINQPAISGSAFSKHFSWKK
jgi:hypothetical protein